MMALGVGDTFGHFKQKDCNGFVSRASLVSHLYFFDMVFSCFPGVYGNVSSGYVYHIYVIICMDANLIYIYIYIT